MRRLIPCFCLVLLCAGISQSQTPDVPKWDFTGAYVYNFLETPPPRTHKSLNGASGAIGWNFRKWAALEGDVTYTTAQINNIRRNLITYTFGPRFTQRNKLAQPFVHALAGGGHLSGFGNSTNGWAGKFGGGVDLVVGDHFAFRAFEVDYYRYHGHTNGVSQQRLDNFTASFGIRIF